MMTRQQRRFAEKRKRLDGLVTALTELVEGATGLLNVYRLPMLTDADLLAVYHDPNPRWRNCLDQLITQLDDRANAGHPVNCLLCETAFVSREIWPAEMVILGPQSFEDLDQPIDYQILSFLLCRQCAATPNSNERILDYYKAQLFQDVRRIDAGTTNHKAGNA